MYIRVLCTIIYQSDDLALSASDNLSPFREDESVRADDSWLNNGLRASKTKKDKRMARPNNEGPLFGRRVDYTSIDQPDQLN